MNDATTALPDQPSRLRELADECVMCGLCLPHCPTFQLSGLESRSPRGRIALARQLQPDLAVDDSVVAAFDTCLQCRACEAVCPAQVRYGEIIESARALTGPGSGSRWRNLVLTRPRWLARALGMGGALARLWPALTRRLGRRARWLLRARMPLPASAAPSGQTVLFGGCVAQSFEREAQDALLRIARVVSAPMALLAGQSCCGALPRHRGDFAKAAALTQHNRRIWSQAGTRAIVALDSGCMASLKQASDGIAVVEACRWLLDHPCTAHLRLRSTPQRIGWYAPCTHRNGVGDAAASAAVLALLPGAQVQAISAGLGCCGAAGPHLLAHPDTADALAEPIIDAVLALKLDVLVTTNVGCALHLSERISARGLTIPVRHPLACLADQLEMD
ncbi:MAG: (Fe-S)-binding protein [Lysobacterales bacterium]|nr:(Fe-S)-binding protein [Rhodanobacteraceae bacterium]